MSAFKTFNNNILNYANKKQTWFNRNYCYLTTIIVIAALCACFFLIQQALANIVATNLHWNMIFMPLQHANFGHLIGNLISFLVVSIFLERHFGSIKYLLLIILTFIPSSLAIFAFSGHWNWVGFSGVNYFLYAIFVCVLVFHFKNYFFGKAKWLFPLIIMGLLMLIMCWSGDNTSITTFFQFGVFTDLLTNTAHWSSAIIGLSVGIFAELYCLGIQKKKVKDIAKRRKLKKEIKKLTPIIKKRILYIASIKAQKRLKLSCK